MADALVSFGATGAAAFGARAGVVVPGAAESEDYSTSFTAGAFYAGQIPSLFGIEGVPFEAGLDLTPTSSEDGRVDAFLYTVRFDLLFSRWASSPRPDLYFVGGYQVVIASPEADGQGADTEYVSGVDLGVGLRPSEGRWDARASYALLAGSGNLGGLFSVTGAFRF